MLPLSIREEPRSCDAVDWLPTARTSARRRTDSTGRKQDGGGKVLFGQGLTARAGVALAVGCRRFCRILPLLALLGVHPASLQGQELSTSRLWDLFHSAATGEGEVERGLEEVRLLRSSTRSELDEARLSAYEGALRAVSANDTAWPPTKLSRARAGLSLLDAAVLAQPSDPEVRYLRLVICHHLPALFGRRGEARADAVALATLLLSDLPRLDEGRRAEMAAFLIETEIVPDSLERGLREIRRPRP